MKLPRFTAKTPPPRETGLIRAQDIGALTRTGGQEFETIAGAGRAIQKTAGLAFEAYQNRQALDDQATMGEISKRATDADTEAVNAIMGFDPSVGDALPNDPKNYYDGTKLNRFDNPQKEAFINTTYKDYEAKILSLAKGIKSPKTRQTWINSQLPDAYQRIMDAANLKHQQYQEQLILGNARAAAAAGDMETANQWVEIAEKYGLIGPKKALIERTNNIKIHKKGVIENIKPMLITAIGMNNKKEDGYKALNAITKELVKEGTLTQAESAEVNKKLGDWMDNYVAGRIKTAKEAEKQTTKETYQELTPMLFDSSLAQERYDTIEKSKLLKPDKERWFEYIKGSYKDTPTKNTPRGHSVSFNAVYDAATLQISPKEAYDVLLEARFKDMSITDEQFNWAIGKIENPYPKHLIEDIRTIVKSNTEDYNRWFKRDNERNKNVNESLLAWVDEQIEQDKVPLFDFKKKMHAMSSALRVGRGADDEIGRIINQGGVEWEIVGFDEYNEALVEPVE